MCRVDIEGAALLLKIRGLTKRRHAEDAVLNLMKFYGDSEEKNLCFHEKEHCLKEELMSLKLIIEEYSDERKVNAMKRLGLPMFSKELL